MNAFMIMCHKNPEQVIRLARLCKTENTDVFIHADLYLPDEQFKTLNIMGKEINAVVLDHRIHGELDHRSLVDIALIMIKAAKTKEKEKGFKYQYYALISGQDYLIKPMSEIEKELEIRYPEPLIDCTPYNKKNWISKKFSKTGMLLQYREWVEHHCRNKLSVTYKILRGVGFVWRKTVQALHITDYDYLIKNNKTLYGGSAWWILPDVVINQVLEKYDSGDIVIERLLETFTPEETFFQILTMESELAGMVSLNTDDTTVQNCRTFAYFKDDYKPFCGHPYILTMDDIKLLESLQTYWFARKFDCKIDCDILDYIDLYILHVVGGE